MPAPSVRVAGALLLGLVLFAYGATSEVAWLFLIAYWCWAAAAAALAYELWNRRGLLVRIDLVAVEDGPASPAEWLPERVLRTGPREPLFEGGLAAVTIAVASTGATRGPARVAATVAGIGVDAGFGRIPAAAAEERRLLGELRRGAVAASGAVLEATDPAGFFRDRAPLADRELGIVYPRFEERRREVRPRELESASTARRGGAGTDVHGVREYRSGDPLRQVHWRLSARLRELIVREHEPPGLRTVLIVLDAAPADAGVADALAREAATEAWACQAEGGRVVAWAPGLEPTLAEASIWPVLEWLARYPTGIRQSSEEPRGVAEAVVIAGSESAGVDALGDLRRRGIAAGVRVVSADGAVRELDAS